MESRKNNNRNTGSRYILFTVAALTALIMSSCKKDDGGIMFDSLPGTYVLTVDYDESNFQYPYYSSGIVIYRGTVPKSYSLQVLSSEKDCAWDIVSNDLPGTFTGFSFQSHSNTDIWWSVGITAGTGGSQELYLGTEQTSSLPDNDDSRFTIHVFSTSGGGKEIAIESYAHPGYYLENLGHTLTGNGLRFAIKGKPENAPRFKLNAIQVGSAI